MRKNQPVAPADQLWYDQTVKAARHALGEGDCQELFMKGYEMPLERAVEYALEDAD